MRIINNKKAITDKCMKYKIVLFEASTYLIPSHISKTIYVKLEVQLALSMNVSYKKMNISDSNIMLTLKAFEY